MPWRSITISVVAVGAFSWAFGWSFGLLLCGILLLHEFGHWIAMRMTGQPAPRMMLIPLLGGVAVGSHRHKVLFHDAFCSLMGPGFSVLPCLGLAVVAYALVPGDSAFGWALRAEGVGTGAERAVFIAIALALMIALLNMLQMVPVLPLDGGQVLRAMLRSFCGAWARWILLALTGGGVYLLLDAGDYILAGVLGLGLLQAWHLGREPTTARPMRFPRAGHNQHRLCRRLGRLYRSHRLWRLAFRRGPGQRRDGRPSAALGPAGLRLITPPVCAPAFPSRA